MMQTPSPQPSPARGRGSSLWWQPTPQKMQRLSWLLVFLTFDLILFGAFTRLTDSGLGCPDWPGCYGNLSPLGARHEITSAQTLMPTGPVTHIKAWIEMLHRYFATFVGALITLKLIWSWMQDRKSIALPLLTFMWVCVQGAFGALTVTMKLFPLIVTLHLLGAMVLLVLLVLQLRTVAGSLSQPTGLFGSWSLAFALLWLQIALGAWVSTNYAVLACSDFPSCAAGVWLPPGVDSSTWREGFTLWRDLGKSSTGEAAGLISFAALQAIHITHRAVALLLTLGLAVLIWKIRTFASLRPLKRWLMALLTLQIITGVSNVIFGWPLLAALIHTGGAAGLVLVMTLIARGLRQSEATHV